ncbi:MAG: ATP-binding protein [Acutalibacter sp.]|jgi:DNA replication protein DnaC
MGYGAKIYQAACQELEIRRRQAEETAQDNLERFFEKCPRAREIRREMARNGANAAIAVLSGGNVREQLTQMKEQGMTLKAEYDKLLAEHRVALADVTPQYQCPLCKDTGFVDGRMCQCLKNLQRQMAFQRLSMDAPLENSTFDNFSLEYYREDEKAYRQMEKVFSACKRYAENFRADSPSFLFWGGTGLGKTHLSLAIAGKAIEKGFGVVYGSAQSFAVALERERFLREQDISEDADVQSQLTDCDLLILDDLGTEASSNYVKSAFYDIINARMMKNKPTLISTNLTMKDMEKRYSPRFTSRIAGYYSKMQFLGSDVRLQKRRRRTSGS